MRAPQLAVGLLSCAAVVYSVNHHLFVGSFKSTHLFSLAFDDELNTLFTEKTFQAHSGHPRLAFNYDKSVLYASEKDGWSSYAVSGPSQLEHTAALELKSRCDGESFEGNKRGQTSLFVSPKFPFMLYGSGRNPCGAVIGVRVDGSLDSIVQNVSFRTTSRIKSQITDLEGQNLFSADQRGNGVWTHRIDPKSGKLDRGTLTEIPIENSRPGKLALHPGGHYLYVLLSKKNAITLYEVIPRPNQTPTLRFANVTFSLLPTCKYAVDFAQEVTANWIAAVDPKIYRGQDLFLSKDGNILYGSVRYRAPRDDDNVAGGDGDRDDDEDDRDNDDEDEDERPASTWSFSNLFGGGRTSGKTDDNNAKQSQGSVWGGTRGGWNSKNVADDIEMIYKDKLDEVHYLDPKLRKRQAPASPGSTPGFITAVLLSDPPNAPKTGINPKGNSRGWPLQMIMQASTPTTGGKSNAVMPAPWNNGYFALADSEVGFVQVWRLDGLAGLPRDGPKAMIQSQSNPMAGNSPIGAGKSGQRASPQISQTLTNIRANIVAEWRAPADAVGDPNQIKGSSGRDPDRGSRPLLRFGGPLMKAGKDAGGERPTRSSLFRRQYEQSGGVIEEGGTPVDSNNAVAPIPSGRGCCADPIWFD
jgi:hypothetical protein